MPHALGARSLPVLEFEFRSSHFKAHGHDANQCDLIVCWEHDWAACPLNVIELKKVLPDLPNRPVEPPGGTTPADAEMNLGKLFDRFQVKEDLQKAYRTFADALLGFDEKVWYRVGAQSITFYSPEQVFVHIKPRRSSIRLFLFTRGNPPEGVKPAGPSEKARWGRMTIRTEADVDRAVAVCKEAWKRVQAALAANETTMGRHVNDEEAEEEDGGGSDT